MGCGVGWCGCRRIQGEQYGVTLLVSLSAGQLILAGVITLVAALLYWTPRSSVVATLLIEGATLYVSLLLVKNNLAFIRLLKVRLRHVLS